MEPGDNDALRKVNLLAPDGTNYDLIVQGGDNNILITPLGADPKIVGGPGKWGDYDPSFGNIPMSDWSRGWGTKDFSENQQGYKFARNIWTPTKNKIFLTPRFEQIELDINHLSMLQFTSKGLGDGTQDASRVIDGTDLYYGQQFIPSHGGNVDRATLWGKWSKGTGTQCVCRVGIWSDSGGLPNALLAISAYVTVTELEDVYQELNFFFASAYKLTASTTYWLVIQIDTIGDGSLQLQSGPAIFGAGASYTAAGGWVGSADPISFALVNRNVTRKKIKFFEFGGAQFAYGVTKAGVVNLYIMGEGGLATSGSSSTLVDTNMGLRGSWSTDQWAGFFLKIVEGTGAGQIRTIASNTNAGSITISGDNWDTNPDTTSRYVIVSPGDWYEITGHGLSNVESVSSAGAVCYFGCGNSTNIRRMAWNTSAAPLQYADDGTNKGSVVFTAGGRVWIANSATGVISYASIVAWGTNLTLTALVTKTPIDVDFRGAGLNAGKVYFIKENGVWFCDAQGDLLYEFPVDMRYFTQSSNGEAVISNQEYLYFNFGGSMQRLSGLAVEQVDPNRDEGMPDDYKGYVSALAPHPAGVFFSVNAGHDGISTVNVFDGLSFHNVLCLGAKGVPFTDITFYPIENEKPILFVATPDAILFQKYPENHTSPIADSTVEFVAQGDIEFAIVDMGSKAMSKLFKELAIWGDNFQLPTSDYYYLKAVVFYNADNAGWVKLGESTDLDFGETLLTFADPTQSLIAGLGNVRELKIRMFLTCWSGTAAVTASPVVWYEDGQTPVVDAITIKGFGRTRIRNVYSFPLDISAVTERLGSGNPDTMFADFYSWSQDTTLLYMTSQHPQLHQKTVIIIPRSLRTTYIDRSNETFAGDFYLELRDA